MANAFIGVDEPDPYDKQIDTESLTVGAETVMRQRVQVAGASATEIAGVDATNGLDVDVTRVIPGTSATHLGKAIDTAVGATDTGVGALFKRVDAPATLTPADGDWTPASVDALGRQWTQTVLAASSESIGKLVANEGVNIGDVGVTSLTPGVTSSSLGKSVQTGIYASGDVAVGALCVRTDTPANRSSADGRYELPQISGGLLWTRVRGLQTPNGDSLVNDTADAIKMTLVDESGAAVDAGSEYTEGDTDTAIDGIAIMWEDSGDTLRAVSASKPLPVAPTSVTPGTAAANLGKQEDAQHASGDVGVAMLARRKDAPAVSAGTDGYYATVDMSPQGGVWSSPVATVGGGCETHLSYDLDETEEDVKTSAGTLYGAYVVNRSTAPVYIKFYNSTAANTTPGTTVPRAVFEVPSNADDHIAANINVPVCGVNFGTAISVAATTDLADDGSPGAPGANEVAITVFYK